MTSLAVVVMVGVATGLATLGGGAIALRFRAILVPLLGFASGAVIGVALFDLLPEALDLGARALSARVLTTAVATGFAVYLVGDRAAHRLSGDDGRLRGHFGPASLTGHSLMDGLGIGLAFQVSSATGVIVAVAVLAHDFLDGANTVTLSLAGGLKPRIARGWLIADAAAPLAGIALSRLIAVPQPVLATLLAVFAGFFLYIGASELLPRAHAQGRPTVIVAATLTGLAFIWAVVRIAGG